MGKYIVGTARLSITVANRTFTYAPGSPIEMIEEWAEPLLKSGSISKADDKKPVEKKTRSKGDGH